jgi:hypothetical protein
MSDERMSGTALIAGAVATIIAISVHPSGRIAPGEVDRVARMLVAVHAFVLCSLPVFFLGAWGLSRILAGSGRLAIIGLVIYAFALTAMMNSAVAGGLVTSAVLRQLLEAAAGSKEGWQMMFRYNGWMDQSYAQVYVAASALAMCCWSVAMVRGRLLARGVGIYGSVLGLSVVIGVLSGLLKVTSHVFLVAILGEAAWFLIVGGLMCKLPSNHRGAAIVQGSSSAA